MVVMRRIFSKSELESIFKALDLDKPNKNEPFVIDDASTECQVDASYSIRISNKSLPISEE